MFRPLNIMVKDSANEWNDSFTLELEQLKPGKSGGCRQIGSSVTKTYSNVPSMQRLSGRDVVTRD